MFSFKKNLICLFTILILSSCGVITREGKYISGDKQYYGNKGKNEKYISVPILSDSKYKNVDFQLIMSMNDGFGIVTIFLLPIIPYPLDKIENSNQNLELSVLNVTKYDKQFLKKIKFYLKTKDSIYKAKFLNKGYINSRFGRYTGNGILERETFEFQFPIMIKDIGKNGVSIIIKYENKKVEIPLQYEKFWQFYDANI